MSNIFPAELLELMDTEKKKTGQTFVLPGELQALMSTPAAPNPAAEAVLNGTEMFPDAAATLAAVEQTPLMQNKDKRMWNPEAGVWGNVAAPTAAGAAQTLNSTVLGGTGFAAAQAAPAYSDMVRWGLQAVQPFLNDLGITPEKTAPLHSRENNAVEQAAKWALGKANEYDKVIGDWERKYTGDNPSYASDVMQGVGSSLAFWLSVFTNPLYGASAESLGEAGDSMRKALENGKYDQSLAPAAYSFLTNMAANYGWDKLGFFNPMLDKIKNPWARGAAKALAEVPAEVGQETGQDITSSATDKTIEQGGGFVDYLGNLLEEAKSFPAKYWELLPTVGMSTLITGGLGAGAEHLLNRGAQQEQTTPAAGQTPTLETMLADVRGEQQQPAQQEPEPGVQGQTAEQGASQRYTLENGKPIAEGTENDFVLKDGQLAWGRVTEELSEGREDVPVGDIRVKVGNEKMGLAHARGHEQDFLNSGYQSAEEFIDHTLGNFNLIVPVGDGKHFAAVDTNQPKSPAAILAWRPEEGGYDLISAYPARRRTVESQKKKSSQTGRAAHPAPAPAPAPSAVDTAISSKPESDANVPYGSDDLIKDTIPQPAAEVKEPARDRNTAKVRTAAGTEVDVRYRVMEADSLIASNTEAGAVNPDYPQELQPRQRDREASRRQINRIANNLDPELLGENRMASDGAPIVGADRVVESGNGRVLAIRQAYRTGGAENYRTWLKENAGRFGLDGAEIDGIKDPVLVRERTGEIDRAQFAREANEASVSRMSPTEQAKADAARMTPEMLAAFDPDRPVQNNREFVQMFADGIVGKNDMGNFMTADGQLSQEGAQRMTNALFAKAYGDTAALNRLSENLDDETKAVTGAMVQAAPKLAALENAVEGGGAKPELSLKNDVSAAANTLAQLRKDGTSVEEYLQQVQMFGEDEISPEAKRLLSFFNRYKRSAKKITTALNRYAELAMNEGAANQGALFDTGRDKRTLLNEGIKYAQDPANYGQGTLFDENEDKTPFKIEAGEDEKAAGTKESPASEKAQPEGQDESALKPEAPAKEITSQQTSAIDKTLNKLTTGQKVEEIRQKVRDGFIRTGYSEDKAEETSHAIMQLMKSTAAMSNRTLDEIAGMWNLDVVKGGEPGKGDFDQSMRQTEFPRAEREDYDEDDPATWPDGPAKDEALTLKAWTEWDNSGEYEDLPDIPEKNEALALKKEFDEYEAWADSHTVEEVLANEEGDARQAEVENRLDELDRILKDKMPKNAEQRLDKLIKAEAKEAEREFQRYEERLESETETYNQTMPNIPTDQLKAVRTRYEGTPQWMKAPNGQATKFTEKQWLQVRTTNFKRTFGNWNYDPKTEVKVTDITEAARDFGFEKTSELKKWLIEQYKGQTVTIDDDGTIVGFSNTKLNGSLKRTRKEGQVDVYSALEELIRNAKYFDFEPGDGKAKHLNLAGQDVYYSAMQTGKKFYSVRFKFDIAKDDLSSTYKDHRVTEIKISPTASHTVNAEKNSAMPHAQAGDTLIYTLSDLTGGVKPRPSVKVLDENGEPKVVYHGTGRADRVGSVFRKDRATSGPMAYFTDNQGMAENYSRNKGDTSLSREGLDEDYRNQFTVEYDWGKERKKSTISKYWLMLPREKQREIAEKAQAIGYDDDYEIALIPGNTTGTGGYVQHLREARGNHLEALVREWLDSGNLFDEEEKFLKVLELAGVEGVQYNDPNARHEAVYPVFLNIKNPLVTTEISNELFDKLTEAAWEEQEKFDPTQGYAADAWDKTSISPVDWLEKLTRDLDNGTTWAWTVIPDWVTEVLKKEGYDGIQDTGGKGGGQGHTVYIPFESEQVKSATDNRGTFDAGDPDIYHQDDARAYTEFLKDAEGQAKSIIHMLENADASSGIHEGAHVYLEIMKKLADAGELNEEGRAVWEALNRELGVERLGWHNAQEKFAASVEKYLMTGKAPTSGLRRVFEAFKKWLGDIYRSVKNITWTDTKGREHRFSISQSMRETLDTIFSAGDEEAAIAREIQRGSRAMEHVLKKHTDVMHAMRRPDLGEIAFIWGTPGKGENFKGGKGISHIIAHRNAQGYDGEAVARKMVEVIAKGDITRRYGENVSGGERVNLSYDGYTAVMSLYKDGERQTWLLTGFNNEPSGASSEGNGSTGATLNGPMRTRPEEGAEESEKSVPETDKGVNSKEQAIHDTLKEAAEQGDTKTIVETLNTEDNPFTETEESRRKPEPVADTGDDVEVRFENDETERRFAESRRSEPKFEDRLIRGLENGEWRELKKAETESGERMAPIREAFRRLARKVKGAPGEATKTLKHLGGLDRRQFDIFARKRMLDNLLWRKEDLPTADLPWGLTEETLRKEHERFTRLAEKDPKIMEAIRREEAEQAEINRKFAELADALGWHDLGEKLRNPHYFHHEILFDGDGGAKNGEKGRKAGGTGLERLMNTIRGRGYLQKYKGSLRDICANYALVTAGVRTQMLQDIAIMETLADIKKNYDKAGELRKKLKPGERLSDAVPDGYAVYDPRGGGLVESGGGVNLETLMSMAAERTGEDAERMAKDLMGPEIYKQSGLGGDIANKITEMLARQENQLMVIPRELKVLLTRAAEKRKTNGFMKALNKLTHAWKLWTLYSPFRTIKYNLRNLSGDADALLAGNPRAYKKVGRSIADLINVMFWGKEAEGDIKDYMERGWAQSTESHNLMDDGQLTFGFEEEEIQRLIDLQKQAEAGKLNWKGLSKKSLKLLNKYSWGGIQHLTEFREQILRYACYLSYKEQMEADLKRGGEGRPDNWGASLKEEVMAVKDIRDRAYKMANELMGAYDQVSETGQKLRRFAVPFYSWLEVNARRYYRLIKNGMTSDSRKDFAAGFLKGTGLKAPLYAYRAARTYAMINLFSMAMKLFNMCWAPEADDDLPPEVQQKPHITLGRDENGNVLYFDRLGSTADIMDWIGEDEALLPFVSTVKDILNGQQTVTGWMKQVGSSAYSKAFNALNPMLKMPMEIATGKTYYPDATKPRIIRDMVDYAASTVGLSREVRALRGEPWPKYAEGVLDWLGQHASYSADPEEGAYFHILDRVRQFQERELGKTFDGAAITRRGEALRKLKTALRFNDRANVKRYLRKYYELGGTSRGLKTSLDRMGPLAGLSKEEQKQFLRWLPKEERKYLTKANQYYRELRSLLSQR